MIFVVCQLFLLVGCFEFFSHSKKLFVFVPNFVFIVFSVFLMEALQIIQAKVP